MNKRDYKIIGITIFAGVFLGWLFFHTSGSESTSHPAQMEQATASEVSNVKRQIWTCSMHPQIRLDHAGKCPICGMELIPVQNLEGDETTISPDEIQMTDDAMKIADIQTMIVTKQAANKDVYLLGRVKPDERNISELTTRFGGRIEKLFVNFTGQDVKKGEKLATIYSPALMTAQKELLETEAYRESNPDFYRAARNKLKLWDLTDEQINEIEKKGEAQSYFDVLSPITGTVTQRNVSPGDYVKEGNSLFEVTDLTKVWVMFDAYESDLPWIKKNDKVSFTVQSIPGKNFTARINFIDPTIDPNTRVAHVRVEVNNPGFLLKPEMFANGMVTSRLGGNSKDLMIPKTAALWTGKRAVVYVKDTSREQPTFAYREITLGPTAGDFYVVEKGLRENEEIAINGVFKIDAAAQLAGKPSMMNPDGTAGSAGGMAGMDMGGGSKNGGSANQAVNMNMKNTTKAQVPEPKFKDQLTCVYKAYLFMKDALIKSNAQEAARLAGNVDSALNSVDIELLKGDAHLTWMGQQRKMKESLMKIMKNKDVAVQREAFADFNVALFNAVKTFGLQGVTTYYQYCPMALDNKGANWLSEVNDIQNPYLGEAMLTCGETKETLKF